jgi:hypothetical protein
VTNQQKDEQTERRGMKNRKRILDEMHATGLFGIQRAGLESRLADMWICANLEKLEAIGIRMTPKL